jgi:hypothetical protein
MRGPSGQWNTDYFANAEIRGASILVNARLVRTEALGDFLNAPNESLRQGLREGK